MDTTTAMTIPTLDPLHQHIYKILNPRRGHTPEDVILTIAHNVAFLVRYTYGLNIAPQHISIPMIDVRGRENEGIGHKVSVVVHEEPGKFTVIVQAQVEWGRHTITRLAKVTDKAIKEII